MRRLPTILLITVVTVAIAAVAFTTGCGNGSQQTGKFHCPMHPTYITERPGDCPICGMRLVKLEDREPGPEDRVSAHPQKGSHSAYVCPMGCPNGRSDKPGDCPDCGMPLVEAGETEPGSGSRGASHMAMEGSTGHSSAPPRTRTHGGGHVLFYRDPMDPSITSPVPAKDSMGMDYVPVYADSETAVPAGGIPGHAAVRISSEGMRLAGIQTTSAVRRALGRTVRAVGTITTDETRIRHVHTKIPGWVEKLYVNFTGQFVREGDPILAIYSPELLAGQEEYLRARETAARFEASTLPEVRKGGRDLVAAARQRLKLFDVPESFLAEIEHTGAVQRTVTLEASVSGYVTMKETFEGQQVEPSMELFTIADLSRVWIEGDFYEYEAGTLRLGQEATVTLPYDPSTTLRGRVAFINPTLDAETRTLKVRFEFPNPGNVLKPGMFANVELRADTMEGIVIPDSALIDTGERQIVFVFQGDGVFEPRAVRVGLRSDGKALLLSGLSEGEHVVDRANFLLDSESRLRAALSAPPPTPGTDVPGKGGSTHVH